MRHSARVRFLPALACAGCLLALPGSTFAAGGSPLHIDPASPVAKEYALPLATARGAPPESAQSGKLFGTGINRTATTVTQPSTAPPAGTTKIVGPTATTTTVAAPPAAPLPTPAPTPATAPQTRAPDQPDRRPAPRMTETTATVTHIAARARPAAYRVLRPGAGSGLLWMAAAGLLVVSLGSAGGLALRRRR